MATGKEHATTENIRELYESMSNGGITADWLDESVRSLITKPALGKDIGAYSWGELVALANDPSVAAGDMAYLIGQTRSITLTGYGNHDFQLIGIGADKPASGTSKLLTFQSVDIITTRAMNSSNVTTGGWGGSAMRTWLNGTFLAAFPKYVRDVIKPVRKQYAATKGGTLATSTDSLFLLSEMEVFGTKTSQTTAEGTHYAHWSQNNSDGARVKKLNGSAYLWWLRSVSSETDFCVVYNGGRLLGYYASNAYGVAPGFCI